MKLSIIIPVLNEEVLLPQLLNQLNDKQLRSENDFEIIVSDGGSKDSTLKIAIQQADIVKAHNKKKSQNIAEGRNRGAEYASGDILIFLNGDVMLADPQGFFSFLKNNFISKDFIAMTCNVKVFPNEEKAADKFYHSFFNNYFRLLNSIGIGMGRGECQIVRREAFQSVKGYNEKLAAGEDFDLFRRLKEKGNILFTNKIWVYESPRRFRKFGYFNITVTWAKNGLSVLFKNKSLSKEWEQVR